MKLSLIFTLATLISVSSLAAPVSVGHHSPAQVSSSKVTEVYLNVSKKLNQQYENYTIRKRSRYTQLEVISSHGETRLALRKKNEKWYC